MAHRTPSSDQPATARTSIATATAPMKSLNFMRGSMNRGEPSDDAASMRLMVGVTPPAVRPPYGSAAMRESAWSLFIASSAATLYDSASVG